MLDPVHPQTVSLEERIRFQQPHLERVSRSFAYGIARLEPRLRAAVGLGYLVCRLLDTVEDAQWASSSDQLQAFHDFERFVTGMATDRAAIRAWADRFPHTISGGERLLLEDAAEVFAQFSSQDAHDRRAMLNPVLSMSRGMASFSTQGFRIVDLTDLNLYCFFVAGVVGELLTGLVEEDLRPNGLDSIWELGTHFGLFLQKVNVLKDQDGDEKEGRFLVPNRALVFASLKANALGAFDYLRSIPLARRDYRLFCAWSLFLGLATVPVLRSGGEKISRLQALALGARVELAILDNERLHSIFNDLIAEAWPVSEAVPAGSISRAREGLAAYSGRLDREALAHLLAGHSART